MSDSRARPRPATPSPSRRSQNTSLFATLQNLISALQLPGQGDVTSPLAQQQIQNVLGGLGQAQTSVLLAQATLGANLSEIQSVQGQDSTQSSNAQVQLSQLQSANLPQVIANYSESVTALQAAEAAFGRIQNLTLFSMIRSLMVAARDRKSPPRTPNVDEKLKFVELVVVVGGR